MPIGIAKLNSTCEQCGNAILPGHQIVWGKGTKSRHSNCETPDAPNAPSYATVPSSNGAGGIDAMINAIVQAQISQFAPQFDQSEIEDLIKSEVEKRLPEYATRIVIENREHGTTKEIEGLVHKQFEVLLTFVQAGENVWLYGAAGGGKSKVCGQVADALELRFRHISLTNMSTPSMLLGYLDANGRYISTEFRNVYENGGVFLFDEIAAANGNLLTVVQTALENGHCAFPDGIVARHADARFLAADNTVGNGASVTYSARQKLDGATRERFVFLKWEYDTKLERELARAHNPVNADYWVDFIHGVRDTCESLKLDSVIASPRASIKGAKLLSHGLSVDLVADAVLFKGCNGDVRDKVLANNPLPQFN